MDLTPSHPRPWLTMALLAAVAIMAGKASSVAAPPEFSFTTAGDMRSYTENPKPDGKRFFDGACAAMQRVGPGAFLISPGDFDPPSAVRAVIDEYLGPKFLWYVVVGNHEVENAAVMPWVRQWLASDIPHLVRRGMPGTQLTLYSFDGGPAHFVAIDTYPFAKAGKPGDKTDPGTKGKVDLTEATFAWLEADLAATSQRFVFVIGHQPIESLPDMDSERGRHGGESVSFDPERSARFASLLTKYHVRAYICGHTHNTSVAKTHGVWQADSGHARGGGDAGSPSTFLKFRLVGNDAWVDIYRADPTGRDYTLRKTVALD